MSVDGIVAMSCVLLTNDVVKVAPSHVATELLLKLWPFTVRVKPAPPAVALLGEIEDTDGVDGQEEQETAGSRSIANAPNRGDFLVIVTPAPLFAIRKFWLRRIFSTASGGTVSAGTPARKRKIMLKRLALSLGTLAVALFAVAPLIAQTTMTLKTAPSGKAAIYSTTSTTFVPVDSTNLSYTVTIPTGYNLLINATGNATSTGSSTVVIGLFDGSTSLVSTDLDSDGPFQPWALTWIIAGNGESHTIKLEYKTATSAYEAVIPYFTTQAEGMVAPVMTFLMAPTS